MKQKAMSHLGVAILLPLPSPPPTGAAGREQHDHTTMSLSLMTTSKYLDLVESIKVCLFFQLWGSGIYTECVSTNYRYMYEYHVDQ